MAKRVHNTRKGDVSQPARLPLEVAKSFSGKSRPEGSDLDSDGQQLAVPRGNTGRRLLPSFKSENQAGRCTWFVSGAYASPSKASGKEQGCKCRLCSVPAPENSKGSGNTWRNAEQLCPAFPSWVSSRSSARRPIPATHVQPCNSSTTQQLNPGRSLSVQMQG